MFGVPVASFYDFSIGFEIVKAVWYFLLLIFNNGNLRFFHFHRRLKKMPPSRCLGRKWRISTDDYFLFGNHLFKLDIFVFLLFSFVVWENPPVTSNMFRRFPYMIPPSVYNILLLDMGYQEGDKVLDN